MIHLVEPVLKQNLTTKHRMNTDCHDDVRKFNDHLHLLSSFFLL